MIKKVIVGLMAVAMLFAMTGLALAVQDNGSGYTSDPNTGIKGNITSNQYNLDTGTWTWGSSSFTFDKIGTLGKDWKERIQGQDASPTATFEPFKLGGLALSTHVYGTWNSPYTFGVDGYNYNDAQDYTTDGEQTTTPAGKIVYTSGPHGGYLTSTHRCRECHAVHRAAGKFKLLRSDTRFEACDWCHGTGAGSGFNIQMDNDDNYTTEYNVGHTMGFGIQSGKWKAPDDTYPAFTPNFWMGGLSCFDCHSPHANPARMLGFDNNGQVRGLAFADPDANYFNGETRYYGIVNPGHGNVTDPPGASLLCIDCHKKTFDLDGNFIGGTPSAVPLYQSGSWLLIKNADREMAETSEAVSYYKLSDALDTTGSLETTQIAVGDEISDMIYAYSQIINNEPTVTAGQLHQFDANNAYPVNKIPIDWNTPIGIAKETNGSAGFDVRTGIPDEPSHSLLWNVNEFCADCHDGNAGLSTVAAPLFSEDRALREQTQTSDRFSSGVGSVESSPTSAAKHWKGEYDIAYGHDENSRHCGRQMQFNPEDGLVFGPHCRNCHKGSSSCGRCHSYSSGANANIGRAIYTANLSRAADNSYDRAPYTEFPGIQGQSTYAVTRTATGETNIALDGHYNSVHTSGAAAGYPNDSFMFKKSRTVPWDSDWRSTEITSNANCSDDGFSWPHRTLGWKMLKDDLFGLDFNGDLISVGQYRHYPNGGDPNNPTSGYKVHDVDSVCLDCHNPTIWNATTASSHADTSSTTKDDYNDELLLRGLP